MKKTFFIVLGVIILGLIAFGVYSGSKSPVASKYTDFAKCIADSGVEFYGAFWCPHCADQEKLFKMSRQQLADINLYVECSTADSQGQLPICKDKKIEGYPTWIYPKPITIKEAGEPMICEANDTKEGCVKRASTFLKSWHFGDISVQSPSDPIVKDGSWTFPAESRTGIISLEKLQEVTSCKLPE